MGTGTTSVLGLSLPVIAAFFLIEAMDSMGRRYELWRAKASQLWNDYELKSARETDERVGLAISIIEAEIAASSDEKAVLAEREAARADFENGFQEGVSEIVHGSEAGALFRRLRSGAVAHATGGSLR